MKKIVLILFSLFIAVMLSACGKNEKADIYTSVYPIQFLVENVAGDEYTVKSIYSKGQAIHGFEPTAKIIEYMSNSKAIFYIGLGLEAFIETNKESIFKNSNLICLSDSLNLVETDGSCGHEGHDHHYLYDAHVWLDPSRMLVMLDVIVDALSELNPDKASIFEENASSLSVDLADLHRDFDLAVQSVPLEKRYIMVDHDAYVYWEDTYGIKRIRLRSDNDSCEVPSAQIQEKINQANELGIKHVVVTKNEAECSNIGIYVSGIGGERVYMHNLGSRTDEEIEEKKNYIVLMRKNLEIVQRILPNTNPS